MLIETDDMGGLYHPLTKAGWQIAEMGQEEHCGCCYATTAQVLDWMRKKGIL